MMLLVVNVLTPLCSFGLCEAVARYVPKHEAAGTLRAFVRQSLKMLLVAAAAGVVPVVLLAGPLGEFFYGWMFADPAGRADFSAGSS
ncbi:MAG: hypothetical protein IH805_06960, partial [Proteobacteria bacterium]|nr:hypothetical protein [Pseudomonadota bacterium]